MALRTKKLSPHIGVEVLDIDLATRPDDATIREIYRLWLDNIMVVFRGPVAQPGGTAPGHLVFRRPRGQRAAEGIPHLRPARHAPRHHADQQHPGPTVRRSARCPMATMMFHHDMIHADIPDKATCLYAVEIPSEGGNTLFASGYAAYETLDPELRDALEGKRAFHHYNYGSQHRGDDIGTPAFSESEHPVFRTHPETGRKAIYVDRLITESIVGMEKSEPVLTRLFDHSEKQRLSSMSMSGRRGDFSALGQPLLDARQTRLPVQRTAPVVAHHGEQRRSAGLTETQMGKVLSEAQIEAYGRDGCLFPVRIMDRAGADALLRQYDALEAGTGAEPQSRFKIKAHLPLTWLNALVRNPVMLDAVEDLIGPDILCWGSSFFTKKARDPRFVSWHQDTTYYGLRPAETVTTWVAFTDSRIESGCVRFVPGNPEGRHPRPRGDDGFPKTF